MISLIWRHELLVEISPNLSGWLRGQLIAIIGYMALLPASLLSSGHHVCLILFSSELLAGMRLGIARFMWRSE